VVDAVPDNPILSIFCSIDFSTLIPDVGTIGVSIAIALAIICDDTEGVPDNPLLKVSRSIAWHADIPAGTTGTHDTPTYINPDGTIEAIAEAMAEALELGLPETPELKTESSCDARTDDIAVIITNYP
jgi:hypothetical protein